jgi:hypothetical protein
VESRVTTYERVKGILADGRWHSVDELREISKAPDRLIARLRRDGLEVIEDPEEELVALVRADAR